MRPKHESRLILDPHFMLALALALSTILLCGCVLFPEGLPAPGAYKGGELTNPPEPGGGASTPPPAPPPSVNRSANATGLNDSANASAAANLSNSTLLNASNRSNQTVLERPMRIVFADVGFADATLIEAGNYTMLVDAGSNDSAYELGAILQASGVSGIDRMIITNWDDGKIGGIRAVTSQFAVHSVWHNGERPDSPRQAQMLQPLDLFDIPAQAVQSGDTFDYGNLSIVVYNPQKERYRSNPNADALAMELSYGKFCLFLPSDMVDEIGAQVAGQSGIGPCQVYKWTYHGNARPEPPLLYERLRPETVVISTGPNDEGLPNPTALERIGISKARLYRTDADGTVVIRAWLNGSYMIDATKNMTALGELMQNNTN